MKMGHEPIPLMGEHPPFTYDRRLWQELPDGGRAKKVLKGAE